MGRRRQRQDRRLVVGARRHRRALPKAGNAGHTLVINGITYKLSLLPSGVVRKGKLSVIGNGVVVDPWALADEIAKIEKLGIGISREHLADCRECAR